MEHHEVVVVGGSHAGLSVSYRLAQNGVDHVVLERHDHVGHAWSHERWDSFTLVTPNWFLRLPDFTYDGAEPDAYMPRDGVVRYLEGFRDMVDPPIRYGADVSGLVRNGSDWRIETDRGMFRARNVVVATGYFHRPRIPCCASALPEHIAQFTPVTYKRPGDLPPGTTLIVGSSMSGVQICEDVVEAGRRCVMAIGSGNRVPRTYRGRDAFAWMVDMGWLSKPVNPVTGEERYAASMVLSGARDRHGINFHSLMARGVTLTGRLNAIEDGVVHVGRNLNASIAQSEEFCASFKRAVDAHITDEGLDVPAARPENTDEGWPVTGPHHDEWERIDLETEDITSVIWATGYACDFSWIREPVLDRRGFPLQTRGIGELPGLYFCGQHWLHTFASGGFFGVGGDPAHIAGHIMQRQGEAHPS